MSSWCVTVHGPDAGRSSEHRFDGLPITIGRDPSNDLQLKERFVSSFHARLEASEEGGLELLDLGSTNGTFVHPLDGAGPERVDAHAGHLLRASGDEFLIGRYRIAVSRSGLASGIALASIDGDAASLNLPPLPGAPANLLLPESSSESPQVHDGASDRFEAVSVESAAAGALSELVGVLAPELNVSSAADMARLVARLRALIWLFCNHFTALTEARARQLDHWALGDSLALGERAGLARLRRPERLAALLLDFRGEGAAILPELERSLTSLLAHDVAVIDGVVSGVGALLKELEPERLEAELREHGGRWRLGSKRSAALWEVYRRRHARLSTGDAALSRVFGSSFARAYAAYLPRRGRRAERGPQS